MASNRLRVGFAEPIPPLDPRHMYDYTSMIILRQVVDTPYRPPIADGPPEPRLVAGTLRSLDDGGGLSYAVGLRSGLRYSDGRPLEPREVLEALDGDEVFRQRAEAELRGEELHIRLREPNARFELFLSLFGVVCRATEAGPIGTGPYRLAEPATADRVRLERNPYSDESVTIEEIEFVHYPVDAQRRPKALLAALETGEVDLAPRLSWRDIGGLKNVAKVLRPVNSTCILFLNTERLPNARVRRALALAIDRLALAKKAFGGDNPLAFQATGLLPPALARCADGIAHSASLARRLLEEEGGPPGPLRLLSIATPRPYNADPLAVANLIAHQLAEVGVEVQVEPGTDVALFRRRALSGDFDLLQSGNVPDTPDPADFYATLLASNAVPDAVANASFAFNYARLRSSELDDAIRAYRLAPTPENQTAIDRWIARETPLFPLLYGRASVAHAWRVRGYQPSVLGSVDFARLRLA